MEKRTMSEKCPITVNFVKHKKLLTVPGRIGLTFAPGGPMQVIGDEEPQQRDVVKDLQVLKGQYKCNTLVTLLEKKEFEILKVKTLRENTKKAGMKSIWFPIKSTKVPDSLQFFDQTIKGVVQKVKMGKTVVVHCKKGLGRSGLFVACCLLHCNFSVAEAISIVRETRQGAIENQLQEDFVYLYAKYLNGE